MSDNTKQKKVRTLSPEQLEKMKLARTAKALERRETKARKKNYNHKQLTNRKKELNY